MTGYAFPALPWEVVKGGIDAQRPMAFMVDSNGDSRVDHLATVIGYRELNGYPEYACWDTWSTSTIRWQRFRAVSSAYEWGVYCGFTFSMDGSTTPDPEPTPTPTPTPVVDTTPPVTTANGADDAWHRTNVTLTMSATDDGSGVSFTEYAVDGGAWVRAGVVTVSLGRKGSNSGVHVVAYRSADLAGNVEAEQYAYVRLDGRVPVTASNANASTYSGSFTLLFSASDAHSGVAATYYALDGKAFKQGVSAQVTGKGTHTVRYYSVDNAANAESVRSVRIVIQ